MGIQYKDFTPEIEKHGYTNLFESLQHCLERANQWLGESQVELINIETVVLPNIWREEGSQTLDQRAQAEVDRLLASHQPSPISAEVEAALIERMGAAAKAHGLDSLPSREP